MAHQEDKMASGNASIKHGSVVSTNAALAVICGFKPKSVKLFLADGASAFWNEDMADASAFKRLTAGTGSLVTSNGITPTEKGFSIGADANINPATATVIYFEALQ
jgi:hypothetical protein